MRDHIAAPPLTLDRARQIRDENGPEALLEEVRQRASRDTSGSILDLIAPEAVGRDGPLAHIPFGVKDNIDTLQWCTAGACTGLASNRPDSTATAVSRLQDAGAVAMVRLNMHELAFGVTSNNAHTGAVTTPYGENRVAGGSSGGCAAAISGGIVPFALGTDTGGSTRIPAAFCGIAGFRPSSGRYPADGVLTLSTTRDTIGPMAATVTDLAEVDGIIAPRTPHDMPSRPLRIGWLNAGRGIDPNVERVLQTARRRLECADLAEFVLIDRPGLDDLDAKMGNAIVFNEALPIWERLTRRLGYPDLAAFARTVESADVRAIIMALPDLARDTRDEFDDAMGDGLTDLRRAYADLFAQDGFDLIAMPTVPVPPPRVGEDEHFVSHLGTLPTFPTLTRFTALAPLTGAPSLSVPAGLDAMGLPVGLMVEGPTGADDLVLRFGEAAETALAAD